MKGKILTACLLTGMLLFGTGADVMARHAAEEYGERRRLERAERMEREQAARAAEQEARRKQEELAEKQAAEAARIEAERKRAEAEAKAEEERIRAEEERARAEAEAEEREAREAEAAAQLAAEREKEHIQQQAKEENKNTVNPETHVSMDVPGNKTESAKQDDGEGVLGRYLRRHADKPADGKTAVPEQKKPVSYLSTKEMELQRLEVDTIDVGGTLLFSDSPEYVSQPGILYSDVIKGDARILYYHVNKMPVPAKVAVVLENTSDQYAVVHITRGGRSAPDADYLKVGRETQRQYFSEKQLQSSIYLEGHQSRVMLESMDETLVLTEQLVYGVYDFSSNVPIRVTVIMYPSSAKPLEFVKSAPVLPKDKARLRGTFTGMDRIMKAREEYNPSDGAAYITFCNDKEDLYKKGIDATDGSLAENNGNYGVLYHIEIPVRRRKKVELFANPMGGVFTGAVRVNTDGPAGAWMRMIPEGAPFFGDNAKAIITLPSKDGSLFLPKGTEIFSLGAFKGDTIHVEMSPPGASNLPYRLILSEP